MSEDPTNAAPLIIPSHLAGPALHREASIAAHDPLSIVTPPGQWAYALSFSLRPEITNGAGAMLTSSRFVFDVAVTHGRIGMGWTNADGTAFVTERQVSGSGHQITFVLRAGEQVGRLVFRNADGAGVPSQFVIHGASVAPIRDHEYPVTVTAREFASESIPLHGGTDVVFDTDGAIAINAARMAWLGGADLPIAGGRVLDAGCGVGHFVPFYRQRNCAVVAVDGREANILELRRRYPDVDARVADVQTMDPAAFGQFDVIHCFGLLYHLDSPVAAIRHFGRMCTGLLIMETMVCDSFQPVSLLVDETKAASQAMGGLGSRPSPAFIATALNRVGFSYVYGAATPPRHPDFQFGWRDNLETTRDGVPLRYIVVASRGRLERGTLVPLLEA